MPARRRSTERRGKFPRTMPLPSHNRAGEKEMAATRKEIQPAMPPTGPPPGNARLPEAGREASLERVVQEIGTHPGHRAPDVSDIERRSGRCPDDLPRIF